jgi:LPS export ABC transporter protein LptC
MGAWLTVFAAACRDANTLPIAAAKKTIVDSADQVIFGSRNLITDRGVLRAEVLSDTSFFFGENTRLEMRIVHGVFFGATGAKDAVLTSRAGTYDMRVGMLEARGEVVITSLDGRRLETPFLRFDQRINQISSESTFVLTEPGRELHGVGFKSDPDMQNIHVTKVLSARTGAVPVPED